MLFGTELSGKLYNQFIEHAKQLETEVYTPLNCITPL